MEKRQCVPYQAPATQRRRVQLESQLLVESPQVVHTGDDVSTDRHVEVKEQEDGGSWTFDSWSN